MRKVELLAPARDLEAGLAAVECGADAVYIGGPGFGARQAAGNPVDDIAALVRRAHLFGVRVYATLNTILLDNELADAASVAQSLLDVGVDALIVQDMAFLKMGLRAGGGALRQAAGGAPEFHASTQTAAMSVERLRFLAAAGFSRVILERALSLDEIRRLRAEASQATRSCLPELEAFVHGAICVGYSGRCYLSRAITDGERSGNRGTCSQPCRLTWDLVEGSGRVLAHGSDAVLARGKHLLSVCDLDLSARLAELLDAGVTSLKIEGRLKDANYVRNVVSHYNAALCALGVERTSAGFSTPDFTPNPAKSFTRGASEWFFDGPGGKLMTSPKSTGEYIGKVGGYEPQRDGLTQKKDVWIRLSNACYPETGDAKLAAGDGICFAAGGETRGTNVNRVVDGRVYLNDSQGVTIGTEIFRNYDHAFTRALSASRTRRRIAVAAEVEVSACEVSVRFVDETGIAVTVSREGDFAPARDPAKMRAVMRDELSRAGDTIFAVGFHPERAAAEPAAAEGSFFVPISVVAALRREGLEKLLAERQAAPCGGSKGEEGVSDELSAGLEGADVDADENITNRLAEQFYRDRGAVSIEPQLELADDLSGAVVMRSRYCLRREMGLCGGMGARGDEPPRELFLVHGSHRFRLETDCRKCEMKLIKL